MAALRQTGSAINATNSWCVMFEWDSFDNKQHSFEGVEINLDCYVTVGTTQHIIAFTALQNADSFFGRCVLYKKTASSTVDYNMSEHHGTRYYTLALIGD